MSLDLARYYAVWGSETVFNGSGVVQSGELVAKVTDTNGNPYEALRIKGDGSLLRPGGVSLQWPTASGTLARLEDIAGGGDVVGPAGATDHALARYDLATGKLIQDSVAILSDAGSLVGLTRLEIEELAGATANLTGLDVNIVATDSAVTLSEAANLAVTVDPSVSVAQSYGLRTTASNYGTVTDVQIGWEGSAWTFNGGTTATQYGIYASAGKSGTGAVTTNVGLHIAAITGGVTNWALQSAGGQSYHVGNLRIGSTTAPTVALDVTGAAKVTGTGTGTALLQEWASSNAYFAIGLAGVVGAGTYSFMSSPGDTNLYINAPSSRAIISRINNSSVVEVAAGYHAPTSAGGASSGRAGVGWNGVYVKSSSSSNSIAIVGGAAGSNVTLTTPVADGTLARIEDITTALIDSLNVDADTLDGVDGAGYALASHAHSAADITSGTLDNARLDADLQTWAGITPGTGVGAALAVNVGTDGAFVVRGGGLGTPSSGTLTSCTGLPTAGLVNGAVTLAKMADLAQDQFIGRVTASTGVPETATITAAARSVLDDASVGAMRTTMGVGTGDSPEFTAINIGHASDSTLARAGAGRLTVEGNPLGTVVKVTDLPGNTAAALNVAWFTPPVTGMYQIIFTVTCTRAATTSSILGAGLNIRYTTGIGATAKIQSVPVYLVGATTATTAAGDNSNAVGTTVIGMVTVYASTAQMAFDVGYTSSGATTMEYSFNARAVYLG